MRLPPTSSGERSRNDARAYSAPPRGWASLFCLFFAMWFASGIVMHFVPFPALTEAERFAGLAPIDLARVAHGPAEAVGASGIADATRVRLLRRSDGPVYLVSARLAVKALRAADLADGAVTSDGGACDCDGLRAPSPIGCGGRACCHIDVLRSVDCIERVRSSPSAISDRAKRQPGHRTLCFIDHWRSRSRYDPPRALVELCRQRRALDLSDRSCAAIRRHGAVSYGGSRFWR